MSFVKWRSRLDVVTHLVWCELGHKSTGTDKSLQSKIIRSIDYVCIDGVSKWPDVAMYSFTNGSGKSLQ